jgi:PBSX family phage terminase large subunit
LAIARESRQCYLAPTLGEAREIAWNILKKELVGIATNINETRLEITVRNLQGTESFIILKGWESVENLRGQYFDKIILDEVAKYKNFWALWQEVLIPTLTDRRGGADFISTPRGFNHFYDLYNKHLTDENWGAFHFTTYDNPHISKEEIDSLKAQMTDTRFAQEYLADFKKSEGLVYQEFKRNLHLFDKAPEGIIETMGGLDFGFNHPMALLTIKVDYANRYWVTNEWYKSSQTNDQLIEKIQSLKLAKLYPDPASPDRIAVLQQHGINCLEVNKGKDSIINGINIVREMFKQNRLFIHNSCINTIAELESYCYDPDDPLKEVPLKENDDAMDALRYVLMMNNQPVIQDFNLQNRIERNRETQNNFR